MIRSTRITCCRVCDSTSLELVLDLGRTALANRFLEADQLSEIEPTFPLRLVRCGTCGAMQIDETVPPHVLFGDYIYVSGTSDAIHQHADRVALWAEERFGLTAGDRVVEPAGNDGTMLKAFQRRGYDVRNVEPAGNIALRAHQSGVPTVTAFFNPSTANYVRSHYGPAKLVLARHVLAHAADLHGFVKGMHDLLDDDGTAVVEVPWLLPFFENVEFDTIYHEHLCYFSVRVLRTLGRRHGLELFDVEEVNLHGGSVLAAFRRASVNPKVRPSVSEFLTREDEADLHDGSAWMNFSQRVEDCRAALRRELVRLRREGKRVIGYGAAAKAMTLLAYAGVTADELPFIADRSPFKQGMFTPGHHIPVVSPDRIREEPADVMLLLAWNFAREIIRQQQSFTDRGGRFLVPLPTAHYWNESWSHKLAMA